MNSFFSLFVRFLTEFCSVGFFIYTLVGFVIFALIQLIRKAVHGI